MEPEKEATTPGSSQDVVKTETILHIDEPVTVEPSLATGTISGIFQGDTPDGNKHIFKHPEHGHIFHVPFLGQMEKALKVASEKGIDPIGKLFQIIILDAGRFLIKIIER